MTCGLPRYDATKCLFFVEETDILVYEVKESKDMRMKTEQRKRSLWIVRGILTISLIGFVLWAWPGYLAHDYYVSKTSSVRHEGTDILPDYSIVILYFVPQKTHLADIQFAVLFEEENVENEEITFILCEESGKEIFSKVIRLDEMESGRYYDVKYIWRLRTDQVYYWELVGSETANVNLRMMYTSYEEDQASENTLFLLNENQVGESTQTISQYTYLVHPDKIVIIGGYWMGLVMVYIICMDVATRLLAGKRESAFSAPAGR